MERLPSMYLEMGSLSAKGMLQRQSKVFQPQLPRSGLIKEVEDGLVLKEWWFESEDFLDFLEVEAEAEAATGPLWDDDWN